MSRMACAGIQITTNGKRGNPTSVAEELATKHCGFYSDKKLGAVKAPFLSHIFRAWPVAHGR